MFIAVSLLLATACLVPAAAKLLGHPKMQKSAAHFGIPWRRYRLIGVAELAAAAGVLAGLWWQPLGVAAATGMVSLLIGALITHRRGAGLREGDGTRAAHPGDHDRLPGHSRHRMTRTWTRMMGNAPLCGRSEPRPPGEPAHAPKSEK